MPRSAQGLRQLTKSAGFCISKGQRNPSFDPQDSRPARISVKKEPGCHKHDIKEDCHTWLLAFGFCFFGGPYVLSFTGASTSTSKQIKSESGKGMGMKPAPRYQRSIISVGHWRRRDRAGELSHRGSSPEIQNPCPRQPSKPFNADTDSSTSPALQCSQRRLLRKMTLSGPPLDLHHLFHQPFHACCYQSSQITAADAVPSPQPGAEPLQSPCSSLLILLRRRYSQCVCIVCMHTKEDSVSP